jgi:hypothetical protein
MELRERHDQQACWLVVIPCANVILVSIANAIGASSDAQRDLVVGLARTVSRHLIPRTVDLQALFHSYTGWMTGGSALARPESIAHFFSQLLRPSFCGKPWRKVVIC